MLESLHPLWERLTTSPNLKMIRFPKTSVWNTWQILGMQNGEYILFDMLLERTHEAVSYFPSCAMAQAEECVFKIDILDLGIL